MSRTDCDIDNNLRCEPEPSSYSKRIRAQVLANWQVLKITWPWFLLFIFNCAPVGWAVGLVYFLEYKFEIPSNALIDFGHKAIPELPYYSVDVAGFLLLSALIWAIGWVLIISIIDCRRGFTIVGALWRTSFVLSAAFIFRSVSFLVTLVPSAGVRCERFPLPGLEGFDPPTSAKEVLNFSTTLRACGDNIFSGHLSFVLTMAIMSTHYTRRWLIALPSWMLVIGEAFALLAQRYHYTVDIWLVIIILPMLWISFYHFFPRDPTNHICFWKDQPARVYE